MFKLSMQFGIDRTPNYDNEVSEKIEEIARDYFDDFGLAQRDFITDCETEESGSGKMLKVTVTYGLDESQAINWLKEEIKPENIANDIKEIFNAQCDVMGEWFELTEKHDEYFEKYRDKVRELAEMCCCESEFERLNTAIAEYVRDCAWEKAVRIYVESSDDQLTWEES